MKIFRSSEKQMKLRVKIPEKQKKVNVAEKLNHAKVDSRKKHVPNAGALISLPVEKAVEKKVQKGESKIKRKLFQFLIFVMC